MGTGRAATMVVLVRGDVEVASWPLAATSRPTLEVADELVRLARAAGRMRCSIRLRDPDPELVELLELVGLAGVVGLGGC